MALFTASFLSRSKQQWKLLVGSVGFVCGFVLVSIAITGPATREDSRLALLLLGGFGLISIAAVWLAFSIRCPEEASRTVTFAKVAERLRDITKTNSEAVEQQGERIGWDIHDVVADPNRLWNYNVERSTTFAGL
jgi:hypothetical protein